MAALIWKMLHTNAVEIYNDYFKTLLKSCNIYYQLWKAQSLEVIA